MTPDDARRMYADRDGRHTAFESDFRALCDRYQVQAAAFYGGFNGVVMTARSAGRDQLVRILSRAAAMIPGIVEGTLTIITGRNGQVWVQPDDDAP